MKKILTLILVIAGAAFFFFSGENESGTKSAQRDEKVEIKKTNRKNKKANAIAISANGKAQLSSSHDHDHGNKQKEEDKFQVEKVKIPTDVAGQSLSSLGSTLSRYTKKNINLNELKADLITSGLSVVSSRDKNKFTGEMVVVRTNNTLPGTRYFHAQVFKDENNNDFIQHMSFEYRPGDKAFAEVVASIKKEFNLSDNATVQKDGFYSWNTDSGHVIWIKRLQAEDLKNDPFNAYTKADVGTIRVAVELEIHN